VISKTSRPFADQENNAAIFIVAQQRFDKPEMPAHDGHQNPAWKGGAHTQFKNKLKADLHKRVESTVRVRSGPSWDERIDKAKKEFSKKSTAVEGEMKKNLTEAIDRGRSRPTSAPIRSASLTPNQMAMLQQRKKKMAEMEGEYREYLGALRDKMEKREPLFRLSEVNQAFLMQEERMRERRRQLAQDEHDRWEHLRNVEENAASRPLLIEDSAYRAPKKTPATQSAPDLKEGATADATSPKTFSFGSRAAYPKDEKIREAIASRWFQESDWGREVAEIKYRADTRQKLHEIAYPNKGDRHALTRNRLMHTFPAQVPSVY